MSDPMADMTASDEGVIEEYRATGGTDEHRARRRGELPV